MSVDFDVVTRALGPAPKLAVPGLELVVVDGPARGQRHRIERGTARIGTAAGSELRVADPTVSRLHCVLQATQTGLRVVDQGSTNGTFVNGVRVLEAEIAGGATLVLGSTVVRVEPAGEPMQIELSRADRFGDVLGASVEMRRTYALLERAAPTEATVLIQGETGTGKEVIARAIHESSRRKSGPFVAIDCGALAENLVESELFGHARGAFSGALQERRGLFEEAENGTIFLDEIGELPLSLQPKLLRALEAREVRRVGANTPKRVNVRVLAATHRPLSRAVNEGTFREDLYHRLAVLEVVLPPLRARREDIPLLAQHFYEQFTGTDDALPRAFCDALSARAWPGNVRELRNFIERAVSLGWSSGASAGGAERPPPAGLEALVPADLPLKDARLRWTEQFEKLYVSSLLRKTSGNVTRAAELAGVNRRSLQRLMAQHGIRSGDGEGADDGDDSEPGDDR